MKIRNIIILILINKEIGNGIWIVKLWINREMKSKRTLLQKSTQNRQFSLQSIMKWEFNIMANSSSNAISVTTNYIQVE